MRSLRAWFVRAAVVFAVTLSASPAFAQLDPLLFLKTYQPNVILVVDTAVRMQHDADEIYYDPRAYTATLGDWTFLPALRLSPAEVNPNYRRLYYGLNYLNGSGDKFSTASIEGVGDREGDKYTKFYERTRLAVARRALNKVVTDNAQSARFSLIRTRQQLPTLPASAGNEQPVLATTFPWSTVGDVSDGRWKITRTLVGGSNNSQVTSGRLVAADAINANTSVKSILQSDFWNGTLGSLLPAGRDDFNTADTPVGLMLDDARAEAARLIAADASGCRNTVVVLIAGGGEGSNNADLLTKAQTFRNVSGRRVPVYVIAIAPATGAERDQLRQIAEESGGRFVEITKAMIEDAFTTTVGAPVPEIVRTAGLAVQHTFVPSTTFNTLPTPELPYGPESEFPVTSPIVGTVDLKGAQHFNPLSGAVETLPDSETEIVKPGTSTVVPQRSNVLVTSAFALPGFEGRVRAIRVYKPEPDTTRPSGYKFVQDGSKLWVASTPAAVSRNIYTVLPGSSTMFKFDATNVTFLSPHLGVNDPAALIDWVRSQPLGAVVGSTPAFLDPPSLDPPPDAEYPAFVDDNQERRTLVFVGGNDGMLHALDARTGIEVWAFIPFNLLPKLRALRYGQSLDAFNYFVDSSPKIADVKVAGSWRTYLFFGQGPGGTYYNTLDVTLDNMADSVSPTAPIGDVLTYFASPQVSWKWSFPRNSIFDTSIAPYGDLNAAAFPVEKSVGETWSDPAIGQVANESGPYAMLVGSGFLKRSVELQPNRGGTRGGRAFYALNAVTGDVLAWREVAADNFGEDDDDCRAANNCSRVKNALQMDPVATGPRDSRFVTKAYIGDLDGRVWRFDLTFDGTTVTMAAPAKLYDAGAPHPLFASMAYVNVIGKEYIFVGTGSDLLPSNGVSHSYSLLVLLENGGTAMKTAEILLAKTDGIAPDEKVTAFPAVAGDIVFFSTTSIDPANICSPFTANLYAFTFTGGPAYDTNGDGFLSAGTGGGGGGGGGNKPVDSPKVFSQAGARATAPFIVDQHLVFSAGESLQMFGNPEDFNNGVGQAGVRILSWRLVR